MGNPSELAYSNIAFLAPIGVALWLKEASVALNITLVGLISGIYHACWPTGLYQPLVACPLFANEFWIMADISISGALVPILAIDMYRTREGLHPHRIFLTVFTLVMSLAVWTSRKHLNYELGIIVLWITVLISLVARKRLPVRIRYLVSSAGFLVAALYSRWRGDVNHCNYIIYHSNWHYYNAAALTQFILAISQHPLPPSLREVEWYIQHCFPRRLRMINI